MPVMSEGTDSPPEGMGEEWPEDEDMPTEFAPDVGPTPSGPESSPTDHVGAPPSDAEPQAGDDIPEQGEKEAEQEELPEFDPQWTEELDGLMFLGRLIDDFYWLGHHFVIKTLSTNDLLEVGLLAKKYQGTTGDAKAYQAALCAACIETVDGKPLTVPITMEPTDTMLANKFHYIVTNWFPPVLDAVYERYLALDAKVMQVISAMQASLGNSQGQTESIPTS